MNGIFATHLHDILELPLDKQDRIRNKRLAIEERNGQFQWTYQLEDGVCTDSLALVTAARFGLPDEIILRAEEFAEYLPEAGYVKHHDSIDTPSQQPFCPNVERKLDFRHAIGVAEELTGQQSISIPPRWSPPPALCNNQSCVYMIELQSDPPSYYVGETDSLLQRLKKHRSRGDIWSASRAIALPVANKSEARAWESRLIQVSAAFFFVVNAAFQQPYFSYFPPKETCPNGLSYGINYRWTNTSSFVSEQFPVKRRSALRNSAEGKILL
jgi:predicted GIY-YIG superfamily endonuclease